MVELLAAPGELALVRISLVGAIEDQALGIEHGLGAADRFRPAPAFSMPDLTSRAIPTPAAPAPR